MRQTLFSRGAVILALGMLLSACATTPAAPASAPTSAPASGATASASAGKTRTITHAMGETAVPASPQRVVVLDTGELDSAVALGIKPVGAVEAQAGAGFPTYLADALEGTEVVGTIGEPNLEKIAVLKPDLILSNKRRHEDIYQQLSQIAPTVFAENVGVVWRDNFLLDANALNKSAEAETILREYDERAANLGKQLSTPPSEIEVSMVRFIPDQIRLYQQGSFIGTVLRDVGFARPASQQLTDKTFVEGNKEQIADMDGDVLFLASYGAAEKTGLAAFKDDPLFKQLSAVQQGKAFEVSDDHWMLGIGVVAANRVLDDLEGYFGSSS